MESHEQTPPSATVDELGSKAIDVVDMFDQANTAGTIECLGDRGALLKDAVDSLRSVLNRDGQQTILDQDQAAPRH